ncbi:hypothetical protein [Nocardia sp. NPDC004260]
MIEMVELLASPQALVGLGVAVLVFGFFPGFILRQVVRMYPKGHPRRAELIAQLYTIDYLVRPVFVAAQLETSLHEGLGLRLTNRRARRLDRRFRKIASSMSRADLIAASVVYDFPDPKELSVVFDITGLHFRTTDGTRQVTAYPWVVRTLALVHPGFEEALATAGVSAPVTVARWKRWYKWRILRTLVEARRVRMYEGPPQPWKHLNPGSLSRFSDDI